MAWSPVLALAQYINNLGVFTQDNKKLWIHEMPYKNQGLLLVQRQQTPTNSGRSAETIITVYGRGNRGSSLYLEMQELIDKISLMRTCKLPAYNLCNCTYENSVNVIMLLQSGIEDLGRDDNDNNVYRFEIFLAHDLGK